MNLGRLVKLVSVWNIKEPWEAGKVGVCMNKEDPWKGSKVSFCVDYRVEKLREAGKVGLCVEYRGTLGGGQSQFLCGIKKDPWQASKTSYLCVHLIGYAITIIS